MTIQADALFLFSAVHNIYAFQLSLPSRIGISLPCH
jgi:hypothetical protein